MSKYTPKLVQLSEGSNAFPLPIHLKSKYQTCYSHTLYGTWPSSTLMPDVGTEFSLCGNSYMISKSKIDVANLELCILSNVFITPKQPLSLIPLCGPLYSQSNYLNISKYKHTISI